MAPADPLHQGPAQCVLIGRIAGLFGLQGAVKVISYTEPRGQILSYEPWYIEARGIWQPLPRTAGGCAGKGIVAHFAGYADRDQAARLLGAEIAIERVQLPALTEGEVYQFDLIGLEAMTPAGIALGKVVDVLSTAAHDVLVIGGDRQRLVPFVRGVYVREIDLETGRIALDWHPDD
ncbi:MAG: ribosome maturation factor RimM [Gammaproteobacteria bacterium]